MLWGRYGGSVQLGSAPPPRLYFIPLTTSIEHEGPLAIELGHRNRDERNLEGCTRALDRAVSGEFDGIIFPSSFLLLPFREDVIARCRHRKLRIVHQITTDSLSSVHGAVISRELTRRLDDGDAANIVFGGDSLPTAEIVGLIARYPTQIYFTFSVRAENRIVDTVLSLKEEVRQRLFFQFPYHTKLGDGHLSCARVNALVVELGHRIPGFRVRPVLGTENFDPRVDPQLELEPMISPLFESRSNNGLDHKNRVPLEVSVIIPTYNNREYVVNTVKHLRRQNFSKSAFEIIVVDDGSNDETESAFREISATFDGEINFKYIFSPRKNPRKMGDANYRAGISRNLGVKNARGTILCFLDSDILTPPNFLDDLVQKHRDYDVIQCKRLNLVSEKSNSAIRYDEIDPASDTFSTEDGYWERFYSTAVWGNEPFFWKYTCTYGLSVSARLFKRVGWIRRGFVFYGFEDVELGFRLARAGARFHLNEIVTYHLFHKNERSEFHNSDYLRQSLLAKTAQIFYLGLLEPEVFYHFRGLMKEQFEIGDFIDFLLRKIGVPVVPTHTIASHERRTNPLEIFFVALNNWRWLLWRQKNRAIQSLKLPATGRAGSSSRNRESYRRIRASFWRVRLYARRAQGSASKLRVAAIRLSYPLRKIYYFSEYQWNSRVRGVRSRGES